MAASMFLSTECICRRHIQFLTFSVIRNHRNTIIKHYDIPPDQPKPLPLTYSPLREDKKIEIPLRKPRDSLSILKALASTVKKDPTAARFMYMDDPYLLPTDNMAKRNYALSKASGRKVARHMAQQYHLYVKDITVAAPSITKLEPQSYAYTVTDTCEAGLIERIDKRAVNDAYDMYIAMKRDDKRPSADTHQRLLELLCVYNSDDPPPQLEQEEFWFRRDLGQCEFNKKREWRKHGIAMEVFDDMTEKTPEAYNTMIRAFSHYRCGEKAVEFYDYARNNAIKLDKATYEKLLTAATTSQIPNVETYEEKLDFIMDVLRSYNDEGHPPTLSIFNSALCATTSLSRSPLSGEFCLSVLAEMRRCQIEPSLGSWHYILSCFYSHARSQSGILYEIVGELESKDLSIRHYSDVEFFFTAMSRCARNLYDVELAYRIDGLLNRGDFNQLLSNGFYQTVYYAQLFRLVCSVDTWDKIMELYNRLIPHIFVPNVQEMIEFLNILDLNAKYDFIPTLFTDMVLFGSIRKNDVMEELLHIMAKQEHSLELQDKFASIAKEIKETHESDQNSNMKNKMTLTGRMVGDLVVLASRVSDLELAWYFMRVFQENMTSFMDHPSEASVLALVDVCIEKRDATKAMLCISLMSDLSFSKTTDATQKILDNLSLETSDRVKLDGLT